MCPRWSLLMVAFVGGLLGSGCAHVRPWEREQLARIEAHGERAGSSRAIENHFWMVREGAAGGTGAPGGGCGCY